MSTDPNQIHDKLVQQLIDNANQQKDAGVDTRIISTAMITAASIYVTYVEAGNQGFLEPDGVTKLCDRFRQQLEFVQKLKKEQLQAAGHNVEQPSPKNS